MEEAGHRAFPDVEKEAIEHALAGRWEQAAAANAEAIRLAPGHVESYNRHAKALIELGRYGEARTSVEMALKLRPGHAIAKRQWERLSKLLETGVARTFNGAAPVARPGAFIADRARTTVTELRNPPPAAALAVVSPGDLLTLSANGNRMTVLTPDGRALGNLEGRLAQHLRKLIQGGNRYEAVAFRVTPSSIAVMIRETYRSKAQAHLVSFPPSLQKYSAVRVEADFDDDADALPDGGPGVRLGEALEEEDIPRPEDDASLRLRAILDSDTQDDSLVSDDALTV
jgi:hypothetical protein